MDIGRLIVRKLEINESQWHGPADICSLFNRHGYSFGRGATHQTPGRSLKRWRLGQLLPEGTVESLPR